MWLSRRIGISGGLKIRVEKSTSRFDPEESYHPPVGELGISGRLRTCVPKGTSQFESEQVDQNNALVVERYTHHLEGVTPVRD
jgi:hypothetical protein